MHRTPEMQQQVEVAAQMLRDEGFSVSTNMMDPSERQRMRVEISAQPEGVLRVAVWMSTRVVMESCLNGAYDPAHLNKFCVKYGEGSHYGTIAVSASDLQTSAQVQRCIAKVRRETGALDTSMTDLLVHLRYEGSTYPFSIQTVAWRLSEMANADRLPSARLENTTLILREFLNSGAALKAMRMLRENGLARFPVCDECHHEHSNYTFSVGMKRNGEGRPLIDAHCTARCPECFTECAPNEYSMLWTAGSDDNIEAAVQQFQQWDLHGARLRAMIRRATRALGDVGSLDSHGVHATLSRLATRINRLGVARLGDRIRTEVVKAVPCAAAAHPHVAGVARHVLELVLAENEDDAVRAALERVAALCVGERKCHACGIHKPKEGNFSDNQWRKRRRRCIACQDANISRTGTRTEEEVPPAQDDDEFTRDTIADFECPVCLSETNERDRCVLHGEERHWVCEECLEDMRLHGMRACPVCRAAL